MNDMFSLRLLDQDLFCRTKVSSRPQIRTSHQATVTSFIGRMLITGGALDRMARLPYRTKEDVPDEYRTMVDNANPFMDDAELSSKSTRHTYRIIANNTDVLEAFRRFGAAMKESTGLSSRDRELVILSVARTLDSAYEWHQHVSVAMDVGFEKEEVLAIAEHEFDIFTEKESTLLEYVAAFTERSVTDNLHERLMEYYDASEIIGITMLAGYYINIDYVGDALDLDLEEEFIGWDLQLFPS